MHDEVDGPAAAASMAPVHELGTRDGEDALSGMPLVRVTRIGLSASGSEHGSEGNGSEALGALGPVHESSVASLARRLTHCFMLMTWLASVRRSIKAAVR